jgi:hypothetical protein
MKKIRYLTMGLRYDPHISVCAVRGTLPERFGSRIR